VPGTGPGGTEAGHWAGASELAGMTSPSLTRVVHDLAPGGRGAGNSPPG